MDGVSCTWAADLLAAFRAGRLSAEEMWCVVLDCHGLVDPRPVVELVLRSHAALASAAPHPSASSRPLAAAVPLDRVNAAPEPAADPLWSGDGANEAEVFVLDEAIDDLSIPA